MRDYGQQLQDESARCARSLTWKPFWLRSPTARRCHRHRHAPHAAHEKEMEFERAAFGITGLETALGLAITRLHREKHIPLARIVELFTAVRRGVSIFAGVVRWCADRLQTLLFSIRRRNGHSKPPSRGQNRKTRRSMVGR